MFNYFIFKEDFGEEVLSNIVDIMFDKFAKKLSSKTQHKKYYRPALSLHLIKV